MLGPRPACGRQMLLKDKSHVELEHVRFSVSGRVQGEACRSHVSPQLYAESALFISAETRSPRVRIGGWAGLTGEHPIKLENAAGRPRSRRVGLAKFK